MLRTMRGVVPILVASLFAAGLFAGILALLVLGRRAGRRRLAQDPEGLRSGLGAVEGAVFALLGLLIAFTFSGASERFDARRSLIVDETNAIGTAWLRVDLVPAAAQPELRDVFRAYVDARIAGYEALPDRDTALPHFARSDALQLEIWRIAVAAADAATDPRLATLLLPALNEMFDITTTRRMAWQMHPPVIVHVMLGAVALTAALLAGYAMAESRHVSRIHAVTLAAVIALTVYVIVDIEYPRAGFVRVDDFDRVLVDLRASME